MPSANDQSGNPAHSQFSKHASGIMRNSSQDILRGNCPKRQISVGKKLTLLVKMLNPDTGILRRVSTGFHSVRPCIIFICPLAFGTVAVEMN